MRTRFGRGRRGRGTADRKAEPIDAGRAFERLIEGGFVPTRSLASVELDGLPSHFAAVGSGETSDGRKLVVAYSPRHGGDAALAALAYAGQLSTDEPFAGDVLAVAPSWSIAARGRIALVGEVPFSFRAVAVSALDDADGTVQPERGVPPLPLAPQRLAELCPGPEAAQIYLRALSALEGLAAKHGGAVRGTSGAAELVLMARRCAVLRPDSAGVLLETLEPERASVTLSSDALAGALDRLEGSLRKRLNDRKVKTGEEGMRATAVPRLIQSAALQAARIWPLGGSDPEVVDVIGLDASGRPVVGFARERLDITTLAALLDAFVALRPMLGGLFAEAAGPLRLAEPRLALASENVDEVVKHALAALAVENDVYELLGARSGAPDVVHRDSASGARPVAERGGDGRGDRSRRRRRGGRRGGRGAEEGEERAAVAGNGDSVAEERGSDGPDIEEMSLFDLDDEGGGASDDESRGAPRRRRRGRRRGGRKSGEGGGASEVSADVEPAREEREERGERKERQERDEPDDRGREDAEPDEDDLVDDDPDAVLSPLSDEMLEASPDEPVVPAYDDDEEEEPEDEADSWMAEREARRLAREKRGTREPAPVVEEGPKPPPRRRSAIVAHADRDSVMAAILLARDIRMLEGFWVYPQEDLMTFFRNVVTDLRGETPIYVVGFPARPARETIQAAALYSGRLVWYDHHDWPPEDLASLRQTIGEDCVEIDPGSGSSIPGVLARRQRRSRFSDKLVELATGRFTQHDFERWGRVWAERIQKVAASRGEQRHAIDPLLVGRPSELAKDAGRVELPDPPPEVAYVSERDFRVVHFGGLELVVVPVPPELDAYLTARLARERFDAQVSLSYRDGEDLVLLGCDESRGRGGLDLGGMVSHLDTKYEWITGMRDDDHVARMRVRDLDTRPERLDEVVAEVAMGRSLLEG